MGADIIIASITPLTATAAFPAAGASGNYINSPATPATVTVAATQPAGIVGGLTDTNTAEGGTSGTAVTTANTGGASGSAFTAVSIGSGATFAPDSTRAAHGTLSYKVATVASAAVYAQWTAPGPMPPQVWFRGYWYFTANPAANTRLVTFLTGATRCAYVQITTLGKLVFIDSGSAGMCSTVAAVPLNAWFRAEGYLTGSAGAGIAELQLFPVLDGILPSEVDTSANGMATAGTPNVFNIGTSAAIASMGPYWVDDLGISTAGYMGPAAPVMNPATVTAAAGFPPVSLTGTITPATATAASTVPVPGVNLALPAVVTATRTIPYPAITSTTATGTASPAVTAATGTIPAPAVTIAATVTATTLAASTAIPVPVVEQDQTVTPATVTAASTIPAATVVVAVNATVTPATVTAIAASATPAVIVPGNASVTAATATATAAFPMPGFLRYRAVPANQAAGATVTVQTGTAAGDLILLFVVDIEASKTISCTGFASVVSTGTMNSTAVLARTADGTEGSTFTLATTGTAGSLRSVIITIAGGATVGPASVYSSAAAVTTIPVPGITIAAADTWAIWICRVASAAPVQPSGFASLLNTGSYLVADLEATAAGATGTETGTCTSSLAQAALIAVSPAVTAYPATVPATAAFPAVTVTTTSVTTAFPATVTATAAFPQATVTAWPILPATVTATAKIWTAWFEAGRVGSFFNGGGVGQFTPMNALWQTWTGTSVPAARYYNGPSDFTLYSDMTAMAAAGIKICLTLRPAYITLSATDLANMTTLLGKLWALGAVVDVCLWHEPYFEGLTAAQYIAMAQYYGPAVRAYYPLVFVTNVSSVTSHSENTYYPGDAYIDKCATDIYGYNYTTQSDRLDLAALPADNAQPPKPFGVWEFNGSADPAHGQTQTQVGTLFTYIQTYMAARLAAGKTNADVLLFDCNQTSFLGNASSDAASFVNGLSSWAAYPSGNCTIARTTSQGNSGTSSMAMTTAASGAMEAYYFPGATSGMPVVASTTQVTVRAWFKAATVARTCQVNILWYTSAGGALTASSGTAVTNTTSGWTQVTLAGVTAPATAAYALPQLQVNGATAAAETHWADDVELYISAPSPNQTNVIGFPWDYRIALWSTLYGALNAAPPSGTNCYVYPVTVTATASVGSPAVSTGGSATVTAPVVAAATTAAGSPVVTGSAVAAPALLAATTAVLAPAVTGSATVTAGALAAASATPAPVVAGSALASPAAFAATVTFPSPAVTGSALASPGVLAAATAVTGVTVSGSALVTTTGVTVTAALPAPVVAGAAALTAATVTVTAAVPAPLVEQDQTAAPAALATTATIPAPAVTAAGSVTVTTLAATAASAAPAVTGDGTVTAATVTATASQPAAVVVTGTPGLVTPATFACAAAVGTVAVSTTGTSIALPGITRAVAAVLVPVVAAGANATVTVTPLAASCGFPVPVVEQDRTVTPAVVTATSTQALVAVPASGGATVLPPILAVPAVAPVPVVEQDRTIAAVTLAATTTVTAPATSPPVFRFNSAEGGSNGTTVTTANSGGASGYTVDGFVNNAPTFSNTVTQSGALSLAFSITTSLQSAVTWNTPGVRQNIWFRSWIYMAAVLPTSNGYLHEQSFTSVVARSGITSAGKLFTYPGAGSFATGTGTYAVNTWYRLETAFIYQSNQVTAQIFDNSGNLLETVTSAASTTTWGASSTASLGALYSTASGTATVYHDNLAVSFNGWIGSGTVFPYWKQNTAEGAATATVLTAANSGGLSGDPIDVLASGTVTFDSSVAHDGLMSYKLGSAAGYTRWNLPGTTSAIWLRAWIYFTAVNLSTAPLYVLGDTATHAASLTYTASTTNRWGVSVAGGSSITGTTTPAVNTWYRIELQVTFGTGTAQTTARISDAGGNLLETITTPANGTCTVPQYASWGNIAGGAAAYNLDSIAVSDQGWIGGVYYTYAGPATVTATAGFPGASVSPALSVPVAAASGFPAPAVSGAATVTPGVITAAVTAPTPAFTAGATATPAVVAAAAVVTPAAVSPGPPAVTAAATVAVPLVEQDQTVTVLVLTLTAALPPPGASCGATAAAAVTATTIVPVPVVEQDQTVTVTALAVTAAVAAAAVTAGTTASAVTVTATSTIPVPVVERDATATAVTVTSAAVMPAAGAASSAVAAPAAPAVSAAVPVPAVSGSAAISPATVTAASAQPAATVTPGPATVAATATVPAPSVRQDQAVTPVPAAAAASIPAPAVATAGNITVLPVTAAFTTAAPVPLVRQDRAITPATVTGTAVAGAPAVSGNARAGTATVTAACTIPVPAVTIATDAAATPGTVTATVTSPACTVTAAATVHTAALTAVTAFPAATAAGRNTLTYLGITAGRIIPQFTAGKIST